MMPACNRTDCFVCSRKKCQILENNDFSKKPCPFFKTVEEFKHKKIHKED